MTLTLMTLMTCVHFFRLIQYHLEFVSLESKMLVEMIYHVQVSWQIRSLVKLVEDGATPSLLLKTQSLACRSRRLGITIGLA